MAKHFQAFDSISEFQRISPQDRSLVATMPDGNGKIVFFRSADGRESYLTQGEAPFRLGISPLGGQALLSDEIMDQIKI